MNREQFDCELPILRAGAYMVARRHQVGTGKRSIAQVLRKRFSTANADMECSEMETPNAVSLTETPEDGWYLIAPYGNFPRPGGDGVQVFQREQADDVVRTFNSIPGKASRYFKNAWHGVKGRWSIPVFEGHSDADQKRWRTMNQLAEVEELHADEKGLWGLVSWNSTALQHRTQELGPLKPSPIFWHEAKDDQGRVFPALLESIGLVVSPNIKTAPQWTANSTLAGNPQAEKNGSTTQTANANPMNEEQMKELRKRLGLPENADVATILESARTANASRATLTERETALTTANSARQTLETNLSTANGQVTTLTTERDQLRTDKTTLTTERDNLRTANAKLVDDLLDVAEKRGVIAPAERDGYKTRLTTANTAEAAVKELKEKKPTLNTKTIELNNNRVDISTANARHSAFNNAVKKRMKDQGCSYDEAFDACMHDTALAGLIDAMKQGKLDEVTA